jgi:hypothetical protein
MLFSCSSDDQNSSNNSPITLLCGSATNNGTILVGVILSAVSSEILYTGGDGTSYASQSINSTGVTGLTATLSAGTFANGSGNLTFSISGTPNSVGQATFALNIGQSCDLRLRVEAIPEIGDSFQGGIVFYLDGNGGGLISAPSNQPVLKWGSCGDLNGSNSSVVPELDGVGDGQANTTYIANNCGDTSGNVAAEVCDALTLNGYSDWFLPSKDELNLMYQNIGQGQGIGVGNVGNFDATFYWSSSEHNAGSAWHQFFFTGNQTTGFKTTSLRVRAVRAF